MYIYDSPYRQPLWDTDNLSKKDIRIAHIGGRCADARGMGLGLSGLRNELAKSASGVSRCRQSSRMEKRRALRRAPFGDGPSGEVRPRSPRALSSSPRMGAVPG